MRCSRFENRFLCWHKTLCY